MELSLLEILVIAIALGVDAFSVAVSIGVCSCLPAQVMRISASFGFFQFVMPVIGWYLGIYITTFLCGYQRWLAFILLLVIGVHMLIESLKKDEEKVDCDRTVGWTLVGLSIATSIDALGVGISFGALQVKLWFSAVVIGITAAIMTYAGMHLGHKISGLFGKRMETVGAVVLILLAFKMLTV